jgi:predicted lysophospholipase L1 biosynthesis ABC-type transport system permease subunit
MALGAGRAQLVGWVAIQGLRLVLPGLLAGIAASVALARVVSGVLFATSPLDPAALAAIAALPLVALAVSLLPARRAARVDAASVLRAG